MKSLVTQLNSCFANFTGPAGGVGFALWNKYSITFLGARKVTKEHSLKNNCYNFVSFHYDKITRPVIAGLKQILSFNIALHKIIIRNSFNVSFINQSEDIKYLAYKE